MTSAPAAWTPIADGIESHRPVLMGTRHMIVAGHYAAAHAGLIVLEAGGNAVDAGVAAAIALGVVQSDIVNVAGVAPIMIYRAEAREVVTISGLGPWPRAAKADLFRDRFGGKIPEGLLRTVVPAAPDAWITALERYGTMSFGEVASAAIRLARDGFPMHTLMAEMIALNLEAYRRWPSNAAVYLPGGRPPQAGEIFVQADLGRTLQYMVDEENAVRPKGGRLAGLEAARRAFYRGDIAARILSFHRENDGWLAEADMAEFRVGIEPPVRSRVGDYDVYACGPWCQGPMLLQALNVLKGIDLRRLGHNSVDYVHAVAEALKLAFADRERYYGDPRFVNVPLDLLLSDAYAGARRALIRPKQAWPELPPAGEAQSDAPAAGAWTGLRAAAGIPPIPRDTSYVCVVDRHGNAFSATPSDISYDTQVVPGTGLCPSSRGSQSWTDPKHASCLAPGKRPRLTPSPAIAISKHGVVFPFGTPGGDVQAQAMLQVFLNVAVFGMNPQQAVEAPRFATFSFPDSWDPHPYYPGRLTLERRIAEETGQILASYGHDVTWWPAWIWRAGAVCAIQADPTQSVLMGGADPRRPSYALGV